MSDIAAIMAGKAVVVPAAVKVPAAVQVPSPIRKWNVRLGHDKRVVEAKTQAEAKKVFMAFMGITGSKHEFEIIEV